MRVELLLIRNALSGQSNELELSPEALHYAIPPDFGENGCLLFATELCENSY